jgi:hypothetical protein
MPCRAMAHTYKSAIVLLIMKTEMFIGPLKNYNEDDWICLYQSESQSLLV